MLILFLSDLLLTLLGTSIFEAAPAKMSTSVHVTPFPGVFNSSITPASLPWDTYSKLHPHCR